MKLADERNKDKADKVYVYVSSSRGRNRAEPIHVQNTTPNKLRAFIVRKIKEEGLI